VPGSDAVAQVAFEDVRVRAECCQFDGRLFVGLRHVDGRLVGVANDGHGRHRQAGWVDVARGAAEEGVPYIASRSLQRHPDEDRFLPGAGLDADLDRGVAQGRRPVVQPEV
jgi:hypothetical protein